MFSLIIPAVLAGMPVAYELDFRPLTFSPRGAYEYTIVLSFPGEPDVRVATLHPRKEGPEGAANFFMEGMDDPRWKLHQVGAQVTIYGYTDVRTRGLRVVGVVGVPVQNLKVEGDGPKPLVRRVPYLPPKKK